MKQIFMEQLEKEEMSKSSAEGINDNEYWAEQAKWQELYEKSEKDRHEKEAELLNTVYMLKSKGQELYRTMGTESYVLRCALFDAEKDIYKLTNKCKVEQKTLDQWLNEVARLKSA